MRSGSPGTATFPRVPPLSRQILPQPLARAQVTLPGLSAPGEWKSPRVKPPWHRARNGPEGFALRPALCFRYLSHNLVSTSSTSCSPGLQQTPTHPPPQSHIPSLAPTAPAQQLLSFCREIPPRVGHLPLCLSKCRFLGPTRNLRNHNFSRRRPGVINLI